MRQGLPALLLVLLPGLVAAPTLAVNGQASNIVITDDALFTKHTELDRAVKTTQNQQAVVNRHHNDLQQLDRQIAELNKALKEAKSALERDYQRMLDEPELDISASQNHYQAIWNQLKEQQKKQLTLEQERQDQEYKLEQLIAAQHTIEQQIAQLDEQKLRARVERLREELQRTAEQKVSFTNRCADTATLAQCAQQTTELALQKSVKQFQTWLIEETSESNLVKQHQTNVALNTHLLGHTINETGFIEGNQFRTVLTAQLNARPALNAPCKLLNIDSQYCFAPGQNEQNQQQEIAWVSLSIRSNLHDDTVLVDDVHYGSTPLEVMLPVGSHTITIQKEGFLPFQQVLGLKSDHQLRAVLQEAPQTPSNETLTPRHPSQPKMISLAQGEYRLGESAARRVQIAHDFAMSATPTTVKQFQYFIDKTGYKTDAELKKFCVAVQGVEVQPMTDTYWSNPGFKQDLNAPVVCVSQNDAQAYAKWLSKETGEHYRLPTEDEWEAAARAGSLQNYWWGDQFGVGSANTGWGGTPWSNLSTSPVYSFEANPLGFFDMVGNVWQWTNEERGLAKGGAWSFSPEMARAESQLLISPSSSANYIGFRLAQDLN